MRLRCARCGYDSGDVRGAENLAAVVRDDGGHWDGSGASCPNDHPCEPSGDEASGRLWPANGFSRPGTIAATILLALAAAGGRLHLPELVVAAWRWDRARLSLEGYDHPDSNRVICELVRLAARGIVRRPEPRVYVLTETGRANAKALAAEPVRLPGVPS